MLYQCLRPLVCNDITDCLLSLGYQRCSNPAWPARHGCAHPCKSAQCMCKSLHALTPLPTLLPSSPLWPREGRVQGGRARLVCASEVAPLMMSCPKLHFAAPGAVCTHFLALSSSFCIWSRLCALLAQHVHHSSRRVQVDTHRNKLQVTS